MSNDYRDKDNSGSGWYYSDDNRYIPQSIVERERRRRERRSSQRMPARRPPRCSPVPPPEDIPTEKSSEPTGFVRTVFVVSLTLLILFIAALVGYYIYLKF